MDACHKSALKKLSATMNLKKMFATKLKLKAYLPQLLTLNECLLEKCIKENVCH